MRVWLSACVSASMRSAPVALWDGGIRALSRSEGHTFYINSHHQTLLSVCVCVWVSENVQLSGVCGSGRWEKVKWEIERERERVIVRHLLALPSCLLKVYSFIRRQSCSAHNVELFSVCSILYAGTSTQGVSTIISTLLETENCSFVFWKMINLKKKRV